MRSHSKGQVRFAIALAAFTMSMLVIAGSGRLGKSQSKNLSVVYTESNLTGTNTNTILGWSNDGNGNLTALPGSPYLTNGTGVLKSNGMQTDADGELIINPEGTLLFAVNEHSNTIAVFTINTDGSLTAASGSPTSSGGQAPASLSLIDKGLSSGDSILIVDNKNSDAQQSGGIPNYTLFDVQPSGSMTPIAGSTFNLAVGSSPSQVLAIPGQHKFIGVGFLANTVSTYQIAPSGLMSLISSLTPPGTSPQTLGGRILSGKNIFYVGLPNQNQIAVYGYNPSAVLTYRTEVANQGQAICWLAINSKGNGLYSAESASGTISLYNIGVPSNPVQRQHFTLAQVNGVEASPSNVAFDPTGKFLYTLDQNDGLHVLSVAANGNLSEPTVPLSLGTTTTIPLGLAALAIPQ